MKPKRDSVKLAAKTRGATQSSRFRIGSRMFATIREAKVFASENINWMEDVQLWSGSQVVRIRLGGKWYRLVEDK